MSCLQRADAPSDSRDCPPCPGRPVLEAVPGRESVLGQGLRIRRVLPSRQRRMVGAWCFLDHAGPMRYGVGQGLAVGPHPHIGLQTFSWMIEGEILHRDSLGYEQIIRPGQVNLMTAGSGISHSEDAVDDCPGSIHLAQLWIALPDAERHRPPAFEHYPDMPVVLRDGFTITVLAGSALGETAPTVVYSPLLGLDLSTTAASQTVLPLDPGFEHAALVLEGEAVIEGQAVAPGTMLYLGTGRHRLEVATQAAARILLLGGTPFEEPVLLWWNFVARTSEEIAQAAADWNAGRRFVRDIGSPSPPPPAPELRDGRIKNAG